MTHARTSEDIERYEWLLSTEGAALMEDINRLSNEGASDLRIAEQLRKTVLVDRVALAMTQRDLRRKARAKFDHADSLFFTREGLEQATSDRIAHHRAERFAHTGHVVDLCCGIGGDLMAIASLPGERQLAAVDLDPVHLMLARANVAMIAPDITLTTMQSNVRDADLSPYTGVFIDPARRSSSGRMGGIVSEPPLDWAIALQDSKRAVGIKTAPGLPHHLIPDGWELEMIALGTDLKEAVLWSPALANGTRTATVITEDSVHQLGELPGPPVPLTIPAAGQWLLDPNPSVTRAGLVEDLARDLAASKIDADIAFLITPASVETPFARGLPIIDALPWHEKQLKGRLRDLDAGPIDIRRRGLAGDVDTITKRLRGKGSRRLMIAMTRVDGEPWAIVCDLA